MPRTLCSGSPQFWLGGHEHSCCGLKRRPYQSRGQRVCPMAWLSRLWTLPSRAPSPGESLPGADVQPGRALDVVARRKRSQTTPSSPGVLMWSSGLGLVAALPPPMGMLAIAAQRALAHPLLELPLAGVDACRGAEPPLRAFGGRAWHPLRAQQLPACPHR